MLDPLTRGSLFHEVQFALLSRAAAPTGCCRSGPTTLSARARPASTASSTRSPARYREQLAPAIPRVWDDGIDGIRADLREWLRRAAEDDGGWVPDRFELAFGLAARERGDADPASVTDAGRRSTARCSCAARSTWSSATARRAPRHRPQDRQGARAPRAS